MVYIYIYIYIQTIVYTIYILSQWAIAMGCIILAINIFIINK